MQALVLILLVLGCSSLFVFVYRVDTSIRHRLFVDIGFVVSATVIIGFAVCAITRVVIGYPSKNGYPDRAVKSQGER